MMLWEKPHPWAKGGKGLGVLGPRPVGRGTKGMLAPPHILPHGGDCEAEQVVSIENDATCPGAVIFYTVDGSEPTVHSMQYKGPFKIKLPVVPQVAVRAIAAAAIDHVTQPATEVFRLHSGLTPAPEWGTTPEGLLHLSHYPGATVYYTTVRDGDPLQGGYLYTGPFSLRADRDRRFYLTAVAVVPGCEPSDKALHEVDVTGDNAPLPPIDPFDDGKDTLPQDTQTRPPDVNTAGTSMTPKRRSTLGRYPYPPLGLDVEHNVNPHSMTVRPMHDLPAGEDGKPLSPSSFGLKVYYCVDGGGFVQLPESDQLVIPLTDTSHIYGFVTSSGSLPDLTPAVSSPVVYLYVPKRPRWESKADMKYILDQAIKWLWEVFNKTKTVHVQWKTTGHSEEAPTLLFCLDKMESAIVLILHHLSSAKLVYPGIKIETEGKVLNDGHFREANDAVSGLYHQLLDLNNVPSQEQLLEVLLEALKDAVYKVKLIVALLPDVPETKKLEAPKWLEDARVRIGSMGWDVVEEVLQGGRETAGICKKRERDDLFPEHGDAMHKLIEELCKRLADAEEAKKKLGADLQQALTDADVLRNDIDTRIAWMQAARIREARLEARVEELRRFPHIPPASPRNEPAPTAIDSHLAFLINPD